MLQLLSGFFLNYIQYYDFLWYTMIFLWCTIIWLFYTGAGDDLKRMLKTWVRWEVNLWWASSDLWIWWWRWMGRRTVLWVHLNVSWQQRDWLKGILATSGWFNRVNAHNQLIKAGRRRQRNVKLNVCWASYRVITWKMS